MANITKIESSKPNQYLINTLEMLLGQAKSGKARTIAYAIGYTEGESANGYEVVTVSDAIHLIGELTALQVKMSMNLTFVETPN